jgi:hypothetical protein
VSFIIPVAAIGSGVSLILWGARMMWTRDDSADKRAADFLRAMPTRLRKYVDSVSFGKDGIQVTLKTNAPVEVKKEIETNVMKV